MVAQNQHHSAAKTTRFSVAPMIDWTDRHCRYFHRQLSKHAHLYTEMIVAEAIIRGDRDYLLAFSEEEHSLALQLGGGDPEKLAEAARIGEQYGYDEINLNVGCPSDRVQSGTFGACLMRTPDLVADCIASMRSAVEVPVTVKCRLGVDEQQPEESLFSLVEKVSVVGCQTFIVHARKAWLNGLSPKENRTIPPLDYEIVRVLKEENPNLEIILNGGVNSLVDAERHLITVDGVMMGRTAYESPFVLAHVDGQIFGDPAPMPTRKAVTEKMIDYLAAYVRDGGRPHAVTRHMLGLFHGQPGARKWRQVLTVEATKRGAGAEVLRKALDQLPQAAFEEAA